MNSLDKLDLVNLVAGTSATTKDSLLLPLDKIEEDTLNVRTIFNDLEIQELAESIKQNGLKTPISVRINPEKPGFYVVNNGARRTRAFKLLGEGKIPAFIDERHDEIDQIIDNLHRVDLTPLEIAVKLDALLKADESLKKETLAARLSKSSTWLSKHLALMKLPEPVKFLYELGRVTSLDALYLLTTKWKKHGTELAKWLEQFHTKDEIISQLTVQEFINGLENKNKAKPTVDTKSEPSDAPTSINNEVTTQVDEPLNPVGAVIDSLVSSTDNEDLTYEDGHDLEDKKQEDSKGADPTIEPEDFELAPSEPDVSLAITDSLLFINLSVEGEAEAKEAFHRDLKDWLVAMQAQYNLRIDTV